MGAQEYQPPAELLSVAEIEERRPLVHKIEQIIRRHNDGFKMRQKHLGPAFYLPRPVLDAYIDNKPRELQELLESNYHLSSSVEVWEPAEDEETRAASSRDKHACIIDRTPDPAITYGFPGFMAAAPRALKQMMSLMGYELNPKPGFGSRGNMFALNRTLAKWRRMGLWTFESIQEPQKANKGWENALKFYWLPDCSKKLEPGENTESIDATIDRIIQCLSVAQSNGLPPRLPGIGTGRYRYWLDVEQMLCSGLIFKVQHETKEEAVVFRNIINMHWVYSRVSMISC
ncbi:uncharacterized protein B0J16DRAFT_379207 [Fusarium flagelliforme]|uniref:uncharacterized protein n=1 Tax=Fusarium flagelliforme TaxID=2675880 RepID=UPI001E8E4106|nr:uncharacterized protein B0J16DRAFT_379207 [Fusarium flagelliforme]KAH7198762.1 hypothetical protein B0J16DRAFT_379207 [Fusarium flagelliforme]